MWYRLQEVRVVRSPCCSWHSSWRSTLCPESDCWWRLLWRHQPRPQRTSLAPQPSCQSCTGLKKGKFKKAANLKLLSQCEYQWVAGFRNLPGLATKGGNCCSNPSNCRCIKYPFSYRFILADGCVTSLFTSYPDVYLNLTHALTHSATWISR